VCLGQLPSPDTAQSPIKRFPSLWLVASYVKPVHIHKIDVTVENSREDIIYKSTKPLSLALTKYSSNQARDYILIHGSLSDTNAALHLM
jgi:hypothetical protein